MDEKVLKKYYLGLDIGTDSVGWCVTDENYNIIKKHAYRETAKGKSVGVHLWGSRLFSEASDSKARRTNRESRRRLARRRQRILMLQDLFKPEMDKLDPEFFDRLNNSAIHMEDKPEGIRYDGLLFPSKYTAGTLTDSSFYKAYPTIYHLRKEMREHPEQKYDLREIYLVTAHSIKYRGNFLTEGEMKPVGSDWQSVLDGFNQINSFIDAINEEKGDDLVHDLKFEIDESKAKKLLAEFRDENRSGHLFDEEGKILNDNKKFTSKDSRSQILNGINGGTCTLGKLFVDQIEMDEDTAKIKIDFGSDDFINDKMPGLASVIGDDRMGMILAMQKLYNFRVLVNLLKGQSYLSDSMVDLYETHKEQLEGLKHLIKTYSPKAYKSFFRELSPDAKEKNYASYIGYNKVRNGKVSTSHATSVDDLYAEIKKLSPFCHVNDENFVWKSEADKEMTSKFMEAMDGKNFLPRQNSRSNGVFPYQLNKAELEIIIENQKKYYPFLGETAQDYLNPKVQSPKIISLLEYKVPYFVGPLSDKDVRGDGNKNHWMVRKEGMEKVRITPYNFHDVIDEDKTAEGFIQRMKNSCTYLMNEETLPKNSLLYQKFVLLNEMNSWLVNGNPLTADQKKKIIEEVYLKHKKVSITALTNYLRMLLKSDTAPSLTTKGTGKELLAEDMHASLSSYIDMMNVKGFGPEFWKDKKLFDKAEEVIFDLTMFEDKRQVENRLNKLGLSDIQKKYLMSLHYEEWGNLSKKLLCGLKTPLRNKSTDEEEQFSILDIMMESSQNFMQIYESKDVSEIKDVAFFNKYDAKGAYTFKEQVEKINSSINLTLDEFIENKYVSASMKRSLHQVIRIIDELKRILKIDHFDSYFVECTRGSEKNPTRKNSRKKQLSDIYKNCLQINDDLKKEVDVNKLSKELESKTDSELRGKKLFLYFMQLGRSVYSGEKIDLDNLQNYDIDHIIPQAKLKDDSLDNTVLVEKKLNSEKKDNYPIPSSILSDRGKDWVNILYTKSHNKSGMPMLMSKSKYDKITRTEPLKEDELVGFVNRQLTMTNQAVKATCEVISEFDPKAHIVYSKAGLVSDFRKAFNLPKCRTTNDFHHANDAYLNIVVGNVYDKVFTSNFTDDILKAKKDNRDSMNINPDHFFRYDKHSFYGSNLVWKAKEYNKVDGKGYVEVPGSKGTIDIIRKYMSYQDPLVTQMQTTQTGKQGFFNKISIHPASLGKADMPLKDKYPFNKENYASEYGGYGDLTAPYFMLVRSEGKNGKHIYSLENIPTVDEVKMDKSKKEEYLAEKRGLKNPQIILGRLLIHTIIGIPGEHGVAKVGIRGKSSDMVLLFNENELKVPAWVNSYEKDISKALGTNLPASKNNEKPNLSYVKSDDVEFTYGGKTFSKEKNEQLYQFLIKERNSIYGYVPGLASALKDIEGTNNTFADLSIIDQLNFLSNFTSLYSVTRSNPADLSLIGLSAKAAIIRFNKKLSPGMMIIAESVTGFYEKVLFTVPED